MRNKIIAHIHNISIYHYIIVDKNPIFKMYIICENHILKKIYILYM